MDKIVYWESADSCITWTAHQEIDLASAILQVERIWQQKMTDIIFEKHKSVETHFKRDYESLRFSRLEGRWSAELQVADNKIPNGLRYLWKSVYTKKMLAKIIRTFFEGNPAVGIKWSRRYTKTTREMDRQSILWYTKLCKLDTKYDFTEKEYLRIRNLAIQKNLNPEIIKKLDSYYDKSFCGTERQARQSGANYSSAAHMGWGSEIRNYIHLAELIEKPHAKGRGQIYKPASCGSLFLNPSIHIPPRTILRLMMSQRKDKKESEK